MIPPLEWPKPTEEASFGAARSRRSAGARIDKAAARRYHRDMLVPVVVGAALLMEFLDATAIVTALPDMARSLHSDPAHLTLAITVYFLALALFIPISGWTADRYGARTVFQAALAVFTAASIGCGLSNSLVTLIGFRALQGAGAALMTPVGRLILLRSFPRAELVRATAWFSMPGLIGPMLGPPLGGFLATYVSWHWIFFINLPFGVIAITLTALTVRNHRAEEPRPFDWMGFLLTAAAISAAIVAMKMPGNGNRTDDLLAAALALGAVVLGALSWRHARHHPHPLLDLTLQRLPTFRLSIGAGFLYRLALNGTIVLLPVLVQTGFGMTAARSSIFMLCGAVGLFAMRPRVRHILRRFGFRATLFWNGLISALSVVLFCALTGATPLVAIGIAFLVCGLSRSLQFMSLSTIVFADVPVAQSSHASSLASMADQFAAALGTGLAGILLQFAASRHGATAPAPDAADIQFALAVLALLTALSAFATLRLHANAGTEVSGNRAA